MEKSSDAFPEEERKEFLEKVTDSIKTLQIKEV